MGTLMLVGVKPAVIEVALQGHQIQMFSTTSRSQLLVYYSIDKEASCRKAAMLCPQKTV